MTRTSKRSLAEGAGIDSAFALRVAADIGDVLGESPTWEPAGGRLYWVDLRRQLLHALNLATGHVDSWPLPETAGAVVARHSGGVVVALKTGLHHFDPKTRTLTELLAIEHGPPENRLNDAKCDQAGRLLCGSMFDFGLQTTGKLYRIDSTLRVSIMRSDVCIPNSIAFSPDGRMLYFADTASGRIECAPYDVDTGEIGSWRIFAEGGIAPGKPDGSTVDAEGYLWNARYGGGCIIRLAPDGRLERKIDLPVSQPTSCAFGGADLTTLFITTSTRKLSNAQKLAEPLAGALLALDVGVKGLIETSFRG